MSNLFCVPASSFKVNRSRDITRQALRWFPEEEEGLKDMFVRYMAALPKSMMVSAPMTPT